MSAKTCPLELTAGQLTGRQALFTRRISGWQKSCPAAIRWLLADRLLADSRVRPISQDVFEESLYLVDAGYLYEGPDRRVVLSRYLPQAEPGSLLGGCYYIASRQHGFAGYCPLEVRYRPFGSATSSSLLSESVLVLDRPSALIVPPALVMDLGQSVLDLYSRGRKLGTLPVFHWPQATFTTEGGIQTTSEFPWTEAADWELAERLERLLTETGADPSDLTCRESGSIV